MDAGASLGCNGSAGWRGRVHRPQGQVVPQQAASISALSSSVVSRDLRDSSKVLWGALVRPRGHHAREARCPDGLQDCTRVAHGDASLDQRVNLSVIGVIREDPSQAGEFPEEGRLRGSSAKRNGVGLVRMMSEELTEQHGRRCVKNTNPGCLWGSSVKARALQVPSRDRRRLPHNLADSRLRADETGLADLRLGHAGRLPVALRIPDGPPARGPQALLRGSGALAFGGGGGATWRGRGSTIAH